MIPIKETEAYFKAREGAVFRGSTSKINRNMVTVEVGLAFREGMTVDLKTLNDPELMNDIIHTLSVTIVKEMRRQCGMSQMDMYEQKVDMDYDCI